MEDISLSQFPKRQPNVRFSTDVPRGNAQEDCTFNDSEMSRPSPGSLTQRFLSRFTDKETYVSSVEMTNMSDYEHTSKPDTEKSCFQTQNVLLPANRTSSDANACNESESAQHISALSLANRQLVLSRRWCGAKLGKLKRLILQIKTYEADPQGRIITLKTQGISEQNERISQRPYISNQITSSRYTLYDFLPRQIAFQFSKVANIYFMTISILQMIPGLSTTGTYTTIIPLSIFILISMAREGYDDIRRHRMDTTENNMPATTVTALKDTYELTTKQWRDLKVGDVVKLQRNDWVPADLILLRSEHDQGVAYIETAALDGETNLKIKRAIPSIADNCTEPRLASLLAVVHSEAPNRDLYNYEGKISHEGSETPLTNEQIIYRGSILRDTSSILALVIFTGEETKIRLNASAFVRIKRPRMQGRVNRIVLVVVTFVVCLSIFCTCGYYIWHAKQETRFWYLEAANSISFLPIFVSFIILYNTMVPLSLYVSMEIVKLIQQILLQQDIDLYHEETNTPAEARTSTINEELGQITHIFSDKTGTLTDNCMVFRRLSVAGHTWLHNSIGKQDEDNSRPFLYHKLRKPRTDPRRSATADFSALENIPRSLPRSSTGDLGLRRASLLLMQRPSTTSWQRPSISRLDSEIHTTTELLNHIQRYPHTSFARRARLSLLAISLCHTVLPSGTVDDGTLNFSAASPDEMALVTAAKELGYMLINRDARSVTIRTYPFGFEHSFVEETYKLHEVLEFSSLRKRMSVVLEFPDGRFCLLCKGADSVITDRLRLKSLAKKKWNEVQKIVTLRRSVDAERALARKSSARPSISRPSESGASRLDTMRNLDEFLDRRKDNRTIIDESVQAQRTMQYALRHSIAIGETSMPLEHAKKMIVDEKLAANEAAILHHTFEHLQAFADEGLRVLLYGHRFLSPEDYIAWKSLYHKASTSFTDRQQNMDEIAGSLEVDLELTSATAIEDKLQAGVPQALEKLGRAGLKVWMLTGDKRETAINIGHSAGLLKDYSTLVILDHNDDNMADLLRQRLLESADGVLAHIVVVIDGVTLDAVEQVPQLLKLFLDLAVKADSAICCRASPAQKAALVRYVRKEIKTSVTLAIGDGANDIAMIREAHVGIGITGKEGLQAARSSDYSIAQFRFLVKLLLVHGRWNYIRISKYVLGTFYKEMLLFLTQAIYQRFAGYTGTSLHENWSLSLFNTLFSSLAVICLGAFEKDLSASTLLAVPELYETSRTGQAFNVKIVLSWIFLAATQAVVSFYLAYFAFGKPSSPDLFPLGDMIFTALVVVINVKLIFIEMHNWSILNYSFFIISFMGWWIWSMLQAEIHNSSKAYFVQDALISGFGRQLAWWASLFLITAALLLLDVGFQAVRSAFLPTEEDCFRELQTDSALKARLEEEAAAELQSGWISDLLEKRAQNEISQADSAYTNVDGHKAKTPMP